MLCPECGGLTRVVDTAAIDDKTYRRRLCLTQHYHQFVTVESVTLDHFPWRHVARRQRMANSGRYIISLDAVARVKERHPVSDVVIHDSENLDERCNTDDIKRKSRFNNLSWAIGKGYRPCEHCMTSPDEEAQTTAVT